MSSMTTPKLPCWNCRKRHIRCDNQKPKCSRCEAKGLECIPVERKAGFRPGSKDVLEDCFGDNQTWVNSKPRRWKCTENLQRDREAIPSQTQSRDAEGSGFSVQDTSIQDDTATEDRDVPSKRRRLISSASQETHSLPLSPANALVPFVVGNQHESAQPGGSISNESHGSIYGVGETPPNLSNTTSPSNHSLPSDAELHPLANVEESCLLRYFIEELSPWFDHCDDCSHFRLVVPLRAQYCLTLRNAIFAVSSRHLSRLPLYNSPQGIVYHGQLLPKLTTSSAVEYMLKCIPDLLTFHEIQDPQKQENLMAAAIILRQYEEMEEEMEEDGTGDGRQQRVNFLAITQTIIYSMISSPLGRSSLATAAYWIAIRQEVYYALTRKRVPCVTFSSQDWKHATVANRMIMHAGEVTKWCWGGKEVHEYERLKLQQQHLISTYTAYLLPILQKPADKTKGEIFPTVWYSTDSQVTGVQHLELASMILTAENPRLRETSNPRAAHRKAEAQVRSIVLNLCGIAVNNFLRRQPALVNAVISIMLYGEYFTDQRERGALMEIIERTKNIHAWPLRSPYERLREQWDLVDGVDI